MGFVQARKEGGPAEAARNCSGRRRRPAAILPRAPRSPPHAELESGASVGTSDLEVKTTTRVRVTPRTDFSAFFRAFAPSLSPPNLPSTSRVELESRDDRRGYPRRWPVDANGTAQSHAHRAMRKHICRAPCPHTHERGCGRAVCGRATRGRAFEIRGRVARFTRAMGRKP